MVKAPKKPIKKRPLYGNPDPIEFNKRLHRHVSGRYYTDVDRYTDFVRTFTSEDNPSGMRVLYQIFMWAGMFTPGPSDPNHLQRTEGARELCYRILALLNAEVKD